MTLRARPRRKTVSQLVSENILALIKADDLRLGQQLPTEHELAERFNVSRSSIREAVKALAVVGLVEIRPGIGTFIAGEAPGPLLNPHHRADASDLRELLEFRLIYEPEGAALAAERATTQDLAELLRCTQALEEGVRQGIRPPEDLGFHLALARATHNKALIDVSSLIVRFYEQDQYMPNETDVADHGAIYLAVANRDAAEARRCMRQHLLNLAPRYSLEIKGDGRDHNR